MDQFHRCSLDGRSGFGDMCSMCRWQPGCCNNGLSFSGSQRTSTPFCKQLDYSTVPSGISKLYRAILTWICPLKWSSKSVQSISSSGVGYSNMFNKSHLFSTSVAFSISISIYIFILFYFLFFYKKLTGVTVTPVIGKTGRKMESV